MLSFATLLWSHSTCRRLRVAAALLALASSPAAAIDYLNVTVQPDSAVPTACFTFSTALRREQRQVTDAFVAIQPPLDHSVDVRGKDLCVSGLRYGETYKVTLKAGLPGVDATVLSKAVPVEVTVPDREPSITFNAAKTVLPFTKGVGLPVKSVNVAKAHVVLYRFNDRTMIDHLADDWFGHNLDSLSQVEDSATKVFEGSLEIASVRNRQVSTTMPIDALVKGLTPGVYVAVATLPTAANKTDGPSATQWFSVADIGLTTVKTRSGMLVVARSLQSAMPKPGVTVKLFSRANEVLGTYRTDTEGRLTIPAGLLRGEHGQAPKVVAAYEPGGGFAWLQVDAPSLDLSRSRHQGSRRAGRQRRLPVDGPWRLSSRRDRAPRRPAARSRRQAGRRPADDPACGAPRRHRGRRQAVGARGCGGRHARLPCARQCDLGHLAVLGKRRRQERDRPGRGVGAGLRAAPARGQGGIPVERAERGGVDRRQRFGGLLSTAVPAPGSQARSKRRCSRQNSPSRISTASRSGSPTNRSCRRR